MKFFVFLILFFKAAQIFAVTNAAADTGSWLLKADSIYGDKMTHFEIKSENKKNYIFMNSNSGDSRKHELSQKDVEFIKKEFDKLPIPPKLPSECHRARLTVVMNNSSKKSVTKDSCFGLHTATEPAYARFSQILVNAL